MLEIDRVTRRAQLWILAFAILGGTLALLYSDSEQQDSGYHFLFARWGWQHPNLFVSVWARPLFTFIYSFPARFGYPAAKLFTVAVCLATAWQTFRLAQQLRFERAELALPLLFLQPAFFLVSSVVMTEPLFALLFVIGLRLHLSGRIKLGMLTISLLILARPEGFFIGALWGCWVLFDRRDPRAWWRRIPETLLLAGGMLSWWLSAYVITGDPLWIAHDWPQDWQVNSRANGIGPIWWYAAVSPLIVGPLLLAPFLFGLVRLLKRREFLLGTWSFLTIFILHSVMYTRGWFGSAGYPRYFVCVSPAIALLTLAGWNGLADRFSSRLRTGALATATLSLSALICLAYVDSWPFTRDARAVEEMQQWFRHNERPVSRLICSQSYMRITFDRDPWENPAFNGDRDHNLELIRQSSRQTLIFWDGETGPKWYRMNAADFESAGYVRLESRKFELEGLLFRFSWPYLGGPRVQQMHLFYKE